MGAGLRSRAHGQLLDRQLQKGPPADLEITGGPKAEQLKLWSPARSQLFATLPDRHGQPRATS